MQKLIRYIFSNSCKTEVSDFEYFGSQTLSEQLSKEGFIIELPAAGHRTEFASSYKSNKPGPVVAFLAEYDTLAGCGHNVFGATFLSFYQC